MKNINVGIAITNLFKLAGLAIGLFAPHGAFTQHPEAVIICFSGFLMAGAELSEKTISSMTQRFLGMPKKEDREAVKSESTADTAESTTDSENR